MGRVVRRYLKAGRLRAALLAQLMFLVLTFPVQASTGHLDIAKIDGIITPIIADFISMTIEKSSERGAGALVLELDTPGGLDLSMRSIVKDILNAPLPVIVYVHPSGARAASAGVMIMMAAHVAAMTPGTNIGAAHPVNLGAGVQEMDDIMKEKVVNDMVAYIKGIALKRGRNAEWAEKAVRESVSITAEEAERLNVIDYIAPTLEKLIEGIEGREVQVGEESVSLSLKGLDRLTVEMGLRYRILNTISNPNIAYILMMIGLLGLYLELSNPGLILPGVAGAVSLILAFVAFQALPINYAGVLLIVVGTLLLFLEIWIVSYGLLSLGGIAALTFGSLMLFETAAPFLKVSLTIILPTVAAISAIFIFVITCALKSQSRKVSTGREGLVGMEGEAMEDIEKRGRVFVHGELWESESEAPVSRGDLVKVTGIQDMVLKVKKL